MFDFFKRKKAYKVMPDIGHSYAMSEDGEPMVTYYNSQFGFFFSVPLDKNDSSYFINIRRPIIFDFENWDKKLPKLPDECDGLIIKNMVNHGVTAFFVLDKNKQSMCVDADDENSEIKRITAKSPFEDISINGALGLHINDDQNSTVNSFDARGVIWNPMEYSLKKDSGLPFYIKTIIPSLIGIDNVEFCFDKNKLVMIIFNYKIRQHDIDDAYKELSYKLKKVLGAPSNIEDNRITWQDNIRIVRWQKESGERGINIQISDTFNF